MLLYIILYILIKYLIRQSNSYLSCNSSGLYIRQNWGITTHDSRLIIYFTTNSSRGYTVFSETRMYGELSLYVCMYSQRWVCILLPHCPAIHCKNCPQLQGSSLATSPSSKSHVPLTTCLVSNASFGMEVYVTIHILQYASIKTFKFYSQYLELHYIIKMICK